jgi:hypothetical protein
VMGAARRRLPHSCGAGGDAPATKRWRARPASTRRQRSPRAGSFDGWPRARSAAPRSGNRNRGHITLIIFLFLLYLYILILIK